MGVPCCYKRDIGKAIHWPSAATRTRHRNAWIRRKKLNLPTYNAANEPAGVESDDEVVADESQLPPSPQHNKPHNEPTYDSDIDIGNRIDFERGTSGNF